jgi:hypothetical protein
MSDTHFCIYIRQRRPKRFGRSWNRRARRSETTICGSLRMQSRWVTLVRNNEGEFPRMRGLKIQNWAL